MCSPFHPSSLRLSKPCPLAESFMTKGYPPVAEPKLLGRTRDTVEVYLKHAQGHLWRVLYPRMQMMPESEWRAYWALVNQKFHGVFTDEGRRAWVARAEAEARAAARAAARDAEREYQRSCERVDANSETISKLVCDSAIDQEAERLIKEAVDAMMKPRPYSSMRTSLRRTTRTTPSKCTKEWATGS